MNGGIPKLFTIKNKKNPIENGISKYPSVRQWIIVGQVDNVVLELWLFTCTVAGSPSGQKCGDAMFHVECVNGYLYPRMGL